MSSDRLATDSISDMYSPAKRSKRYNNTLLSLGRWENLVIKYACQVVSRMWCWPIPSPAIYLYGQQPSLSHTTNERLYVKNKKDFFLLLSYIYIYYGIPRPFRRQATIGCHPLFIPQTSLNHIPRVSCRIRKLSIFFLSFLFLSFFFTERDEQYNNYRVAMMTKLLIHSYIDA